MWIALGVKMLLCPVSKSALQTLRDARLHCNIGPILPNTLEELPIPRDRDAHEPTAIGYLGSPMPRKGLHLLAEIAVGMLDLDVQWLIFGIDAGAQDEYVQQCRALLARAGLTDRVVWGGKVKDPDEAYERMDILLVPSLEESWCRVAMEGMAVGLPVVGTAIPGLSELLGLVEDAPMFAVDCPDEAASIFANWLASPRKGDPWSTGSGGGTPFRRRVNRSKATLPLLGPPCGSVQGVTPDRPGQSWEKQSGARR